MRFNKKGMTVTEIIVAAIIVCTLFALTYRTAFRSIQKRVIVTEGLAVLQNIMNFAKAYYIENGCWPTYFTFLAVDGGPTLRYGHPEVARSDFDGTYFTEECFFPGGGQKSGPGFNCHEAFWQPPIGQLPYSRTFVIGFKPYASNPAYAPKANMVINWYQSTNPQNVDSCIYMDNNGVINSDFPDVGLPHGWPQDVQPSY